MRAIAIDGPAGAGKSTIARAVAARLGFLYVDTGAMYRAVALAASRRGVDLEDEDAMGRIAEAISIDFDASGTRILLDGEDVSDDIRTPEVTRITRYAARARPVRTILVRRQREMAANRPVVMEGRDITTVVCPEARWRFFLTASAEERARRRCDEMRDRGHAADYDAVLEEIRARDASDTSVGPMKEALAIARAGGGIRLVDTTELTPDQVIDTIVDHVRTDEEAIDTDA